MQELIQQRMINWAIFAHQNLLLLKMMQKVYTLPYHDVSMQCKLHSPSSHPHFSSLSLSYSPFFFSSLPPLLPSFPHLLILTSAVATGLYCRHARNRLVSNFRSYVILRMRTKTKRSANVLYRRLNVCVPLKMPM